jgi:formyl-CoA transferase
LQAAMQDSVMHYSRGMFISQARSGKAATRNRGGVNVPSGIFPCKPGGPNDYVYMLTSRANAEHWMRLVKLIGREDLIGDPRFDKASERVKHEAEVNEIVTEWTRQHTKQEATALISGAGVPAGAVFDSQELIDEPTFWSRGILQTMHHGDHQMAMTTWPVRFDGAPVPVKPAPLLGEHTAEALSDWLGLDEGEVNALKADGVV